MRAIPHRGMRPEAAAVCSRIAILVSLFLALDAFLAGAVRGEITFRHRLVDRFPIEGDSSASSLVADLDGDGVDDLVRSAPGRALCESFAGGERRVLDDVTLDSAAVVTTLGDVTGDGRADLLSVYQRGGAYWVSCRDLRSPRGAPLYTLGPFLERCREMSKMRAKGSVHAFEPFDLNADGRPELLVGVDPFVPGVEPRHLVCYDGPTGRELWRRDSASPVTTVQWLDRRDGDGRDLILTSYGPSNGFRVGDETDDTSYVACVEPSGRTRWSRAMAGRFSGAWVCLADVDGGGEREIVATTSAPGDTGAGEVPRILVLDRHDGRILRAARVPSFLRGFSTADLDGDGAPEILSLGQDQILYCFDRHLQLLWKSQERAFSGIVGIGDLSGGGRVRIVACTPTELFVLDERGHVLAEQDLRTRLLYSSKLRLKDRTCIYASTANGAAHVYALKPPTVPPGALARGGGLVVVGAGAAGIVVRRRRRAERVVDRGEAQDRLLDAMVAFGHSGASLGVLHRLQLHLRNWQRASVAPDGPMALKALGDDFDASVLPDLVRLVALARRAHVKAQHWRPLARLALTSSAHLQPLVDGKEAPESHVRRAEDALEQVDVCLQGLRAHLHEVFRTSLEPALRRALARHVVELEAARVEANLEPGAAADACGFVASSQLDKVLDNLIENAVRAMDGQAPRRLTLALAAEGAYCAVDVTDTGRGIAECDHKRIFERAATSREGGGFGLHFARESLARYEGRIFVQRSTPGAGTTFRVLVRGA